MLVTMQNEIAPKGTVFWCPECGRLSADRNGTQPLDVGWTAQCADIALLVYDKDLHVDPATGRIGEATLAHDITPIKGETT